MKLQKIISIFSISLLICSNSFILSGFDEKIKNIKRSYKQKKTDKELIGKNLNKLFEDRIQNLVKRNFEKEINKFFLVINENDKFLNEIGVLDEILDLYFKKTKLTPNSICVEEYLGKSNLSFFQIAANSAVYSESSYILFEKLLQRGGNPELVTKGFLRSSSTIDDIQKACRFYCRSDKSKNEDMNKIFELRCNRVQKALERLKK